MHKSIFYLRATTLAFLTACAGGTPTGDDGPPPAPSAVGGIYMGLRVDFQGRQHPDHYTFLADGRAFRGTPDEGLDRPLDWAAVCAASECGTYSVRGSQVSFDREAADVQLFEVDAEGVLRKPGSTQGYRRMQLVDAERLNATYGWVSGSDTLMAITLRGDGRFQEHGTLAFTAWSYDRPGPESGAGTYTLTRGTLTLRYEDGTVAHLLLVVPPGVSAAGAPEKVYLRTTTLDRLR